MEIIFINKERYNLIHDLLNKINKIVERIENKDVNNISIERLVDEETNKNLLTNGFDTHRTAKQVRNSIQNYLHSHWLGEYQVEKKIKNEWKAGFAASNVNYAKQLCEYTMADGSEARIRNNTNGALIYKQGENWVEFK